MLEKLSEYARLLSELVPQWRKVSEHDNRSIQNT